MKVMPLLSVMKYGWHYSNAGIGMSRLLRSELFLYPLKGYCLKNVCLCLRTHVHRYNEHRILPYKIHIPKNILIGLSLNRLVDVVADRDAGLP